MFYDKVFDSLLRGARMKICEIADIKKQDKILDVCCGTGAQASLFSKKSDSVYAIDLDQRMIEFALKRKNKVSFGVAYAEYLPFPSDFFDIVSISLALHEKDEQLRKAVVSEIKRVVKKNGKIIIVDYNMPLSFSFLIKTIERLAGEHHFRCFNNYLLKGGLETILKENNLEISASASAVGGIIKIIKIKKHES
jgi:ubiquinone/menaquinone biosynthesis C-methylase UbiE